MIRQFELVERVKAYDANADEDLLNRAYVFSMKAHGSQTRESGDPYFSHPLEVAGILTEMKLDSASIVTALLHDTIEDTGVVPEEIDRQFGKEVARLVDGVTKLSRIELQSDRTEQAENFRKFLLAMSQDIRVLLVKLADRLHNMRTLHHVKDPEKRQRIAHETLEIYAVLAERMGMQRLRDELEDLAFAQLHPEARESVMSRLEFLRAQGADLVDRIVDELTETLAHEGIEARILGREKRPHSIWRKMRRKNVGFGQLADIMAFRVVVDSIPDCYRALGVIHSAYSMVPGRFKDYISTPKPNDYRSIHTGVIGPERKRIEIQIRTGEFDEVAEIGVAAHWIYKQGAERVDGRQYRWLRELLDILEHAAGPEEFLEHTRLEMFQDQVFCFTPKGDMVVLPRGATPVDLAYKVHSEIGDACVGAKVNGQLMPLRTQLNNGDQVEIVVSSGKTPAPTWEGFVATGKARARIRRFVRGRQREEYLSLGKAILERAFGDIETTYTKRALKTVLARFSRDNVEDLIAAVGEGLFTGAEIADAVAGQGEGGPASGSSEVPGAGPGTGKVISIARARDKRRANSESAIPIRGLIPGMAVHFAGCCHPLPGDRIVGIVTTGKGITVHTIDCESLESFADSPERWLDVSWDEQSENTTNRVARLSVVVTNQRGSLSRLTSVIAENLGNIMNLKITNRSTDFFEMVIDVEVQNVGHLADIIAALRSDPVINSVERARG